jgi:hypothetical protein
LSPVPPPPPDKDVVYQALFNVNDTDGEPQEHGDVTIEVISLICTHLYLTVSRLMKNQLVFVSCQQFFSLARLCFGTEMDSCRLASSSDVARTTERIKAKKNQQNERKRTGKVQKGCPTFTK